MAKPVVPARGTPRRESYRMAATDRSSSRPAAAFPDFRYTALADGLNPGRGRAAKGMTPFSVRLARTFSI
jgi:hypothetical protein